MGIPPSATDDYRLEREKPVGEGKMRCDRSIARILCCRPGSVNESTEPPRLVTNCHACGCATLRNRRALCPARGLCSFAAPPPRRALRLLSETPLYVKF